MLCKLRSAPGAKAVTQSEKVKVPEFTAGEERIADNQVVALIWAANDPIKRTSREWPLTAGSAIRRSGFVGACRTFDPA